MNRVEYLLNCLIEECAEVQQRATKALRFGLKEIQKDQLLTNEQRINYELNDLATVVFLLQEMNVGVSLATSTAKIEKIEKYIKYSKELGILQEQT